MTHQLFIGLMSGTSMDGIDGVLVDLAQQQHQILAHCSRPWPDDLRRQLQDLAHPGANEIDRMGVSDALAADQFAQVVKQLLSHSGHSPEQITAIGSHGQTIRHRPGSNPPFTLQIGDPNRIAEQTGITVVADFRRRDMACNGQGAPLAPGYHRARFQGEESRVILNLGGIANITYLPADLQLPVIGFDTGPANTLLDAWAKHHLGTPYDGSGKWASSGKPHPVLLERLLADSYFDLPPPKSTGPEYFNLPWLENHAAELTDSISSQDIQATLLQLSCRTIADAIEQHAPRGQRVIACGGGVHNQAMMQHLSQMLGDLPLESSQAHGLDPDLVEATAFAWLAQQTLSGQAGNLPAVTGASKPAILGAIYPG